MSAAVTALRPKAKLSPSREHLQAVIAAKRAAETHLKEAESIRLRGQGVIEETRMVLDATAEAEEASSAELSVALANWARTGGDRPSMAPSPALVQARAARAEAERQHRAAIAADEALAADVAAREAELAVAQRALGEAIIAVATEEGEALGAELIELNQRSMLLKHALYTFAMNRHLPTGEIGYLGLSDEARQSIGVYSPPGGWDTTFPAIAQQWNDHLRRLERDPAASFNLGF